MISFEIPSVAKYRRSNTPSNNTGRYGCSHEQNLNRTSNSRGGDVYERPNQTIVHNHYNITINVMPDTSPERISQMVNEMITIAERVKPSKRN